MAPLHVDRIPRFRHGLAPRNDNAPAVPYLVVSTPRLPRSLAGHARLDSLHQPASRSALCLCAHYYRAHGAQRAWPVSTASPSHDVPLSNRRRRCVAVELSRLALAGKGGSSTEGVRRLGAGTLGYFGTGVVIHPRAPLLLSTYRRHDCARHVSSAAHPSARKERDVPPSTAQPSPWTP
jgi:hypothetical protein